MISGSGRLKAVTLRDQLFHMEPGAIFDHLSWWENICGKVPPGTKAVLASPYVVSFLNKFKFGRFCGPRSAMWNRQYELVTNPPFEVMCSNGVGRDIVIALVEE